MFPFKQRTRFMQHFLIGDSESGGISGANTVGKQYFNTESLVGSYFKSIGARTRLLHIFHRNRKHERGMMIWKLTACPVRLFGCPKIDSNAPLSLHGDQFGSLCVTPKGEKAILGGFKHGEDFALDGSAGD